MTDTSGTDTSAASLAGPGELTGMVAAQKKGEARGVFSVCSANPFVLDAALRTADERGTTLLVEATSNQVNQYGGYTGATPADFARALVERARETGLPEGRVLFGGDHLGPHPWASEPAEAAMDKAREMVRQYVRAGAAKIHLDASMNLADDPEGALEPSTAAERTADLCAASEAERPTGGRKPVYVIGTEVPPPGGERDGAAGPEVTRPEDAQATLDLTREAFGRRGLDDAWSRVVGLVVQPGVEFGDERVHEYAPDEARALVALIEGVPGIVYEAHSTDYQRPDLLQALVRDHFAILKVGPWLTFALREALFALETMEREWLEGRKDATPSRLRAVVEAAMVQEPVYWKAFYGGDEARQRFARAFSFSDRVRYYWPRPEVDAALGLLLANIDAYSPPLPLLSQHLPQAYEAVRAGRIRLQARDLVRFSIRQVLDVYTDACLGPSGAPSPSAPATL